jgi:hypothetical protein
MNRGADFTPRSCNEKFSPVGSTPGRERSHRVAMGPFVAATTVSIRTTCPDSCPFKGSAGLQHGCYSVGGFTQIKGRKLDDGSRHLTADDVIAEEARLIGRAFSGRQIPQDGARGGRDLRLHVGGDVGTGAGTRLLAAAADHWRARGGGQVWTFTHRWREVPRAAWGNSISVLASVEAVADFEAARAQGYAVAIVLETLPADGKAFVLPGSNQKVIPCPAETRGVTCVECRLCLNDGRIVGKAAIAFGIHGKQKEKAREALRLVNSPPQN